MATSGTYSWSPGAGDLTLQAFRRCGVKRVEITSEHLLDAANEANLCQVEFSNKQPNLWTAETISISLTPSQATETLPSRVISILSAFISITDSTGTVRDTVISPLSTTEYHALSHKDEEGIPSSYWFDRQITPQITLWPVPDDEQTYELKLRVLSQPEDAVLRSGTTLDMPYRWLDAFVACLAYRLAIIYAPERAVALKAVADQAWATAAKEDQENVPMVVAPLLDGYFR